MKVSTPTGLFARVARHFVVILGLAFVLTTVLTMTSWSEDAHALIACRGDPIVQLSDGSFVDMTASLATDSSNVRNVLYTLHAPIGTVVVKIIYTGGVLSGKESFLFFSDQLFHHYQVTTFATTSVATSVTASTAVVLSGGSQSYQSTSATGTNNQNILTQVSW